MNDRPTHGVKRAKQTNIGEMNPIWEQRETERQRGRQKERGGDRGRGRD